MSHESHASLAFKDEDAQGISGQVISLRSADVLLLAAQF